MNPTATPKERFHHIEANRKVAADLLCNQTMRGLIDVGMAEFVRVESQKVKDPDRGARIEGAHEFVKVLLSLAIPTTRAARVDQDNLQQPS